MKVLIVGCGAVGQVYGLALQGAGVSLGFQARPAAAERLNRAREGGGLRLFEVSHRLRHDPIEHRLTDYEVLADTAACRRFEPDQVWFTTPSQAYYTDWFRDFLSEVPARRVVCFAPEGSRLEFLSEPPGDRVVFGGTTFMAWQGDLDGGGGRPGAVNFWRPPLGISLAGAPDACREVARLLQPAGFRVMIQNPGGRTQAAVAAAMTTFVAGVELAGWSLKAYRRSPWLGCAAGACREAILGQLPRANALTRGALSGPTLAACFSLTARLLPPLVPLDLERFLKFHYTKTREQTLVLLNLFMKDSAACGVAVTHIQRLLEGMQRSGHNIQSDRELNAG